MKETEGAREKELKKLRELSTPEGALIQESEGDEVSRGHSHHARQEFNGTHTLGDAAFSIKTTCSLSLIL